MGEERRQPTCRGMERRSCGVRGTSSGVLAAINIGVGEDAGRAAPNALIGAHTTNCHRVARVGVGHLCAPIADADEGAVLT